MQANAAKLVPTVALAHVAGAVIGTAVGVGLWLAGQAFGGTCGLLAVWCLLPGLALGGLAWGLTRGRTRKPINPIGPLFFGAFSSLAWLLATLLLAGTHALTLKVVRAAVFSGAFSAVILTGGIAFSLGIKRLNPWAVWMLAAATLGQVAVAAAGGADLGDLQPTWLVIPAYAFAQAATAGPIGWLRWRLALDSAARAAAPKPVRLGPPPLPPIPPPGWQ